MVMSYLDASNNFVNISFNETSQVNCFFTGSAVHVNESKHCMVKYGPETSTGCNYTLRNNGSSTSSSVSIGLTWNDTQATICFTILAKSGEKSIYVEGSYHLNSKYPILHKTLTIMLHNNYRKP